MTVIIAALVGFLASRVLWIGLKQSWHRQPLMRTNYQGVSLPTAAGAVLSFALLAVEAIRAVFGAAGIGANPGLSAPRAATLVLVVGFTVLGLLDDLTGTTRVRGLAGHLKALAKGELTTGAVKLIVGAAVSLVGVAMLMPTGFGSLVISAAVVALTANLFNLLDVRPGRSTKTGVLAFAVLAVVTGFDIALVPVAIVVGAAAALMFDDLRERLMMGDTGSNALGAALGIGIITQVGATGRAVALVVLLGLTLLSEFVSFSKLIDSISPLRAFDNLGRRRPSTVDVREEQPAQETAPFESVRHTPAPIRATVGGAHEGSSTGAPRPAEQSSDPVSEERPAGSTRPFNISRDEPASDDLFGFNPPRNS